MSKIPVEPLEKRIPFNKSVRRKVVLAFEELCKELSLNSSNVTEELLINFVNEFREKKIRRKRK